MKITPEDLQEARERAEKAIEYLSEEQRWELLRDRILADQEEQREIALRLLELEAIRDIVCPNVKRKDWTAVRGEREDVDKWIHRVRLAHALGIDRGKL